MCGTGKKRYSSTHGFFLAFFSLITLAAIGQPQHSLWFFGNNSGIDFSGAPASIGGPLASDEGCTSICDDTGQLLFFTNGVDVWDASGTQMPNGNGLNGNISSAQSAIIVPIPDSAGFFYIFTAPAGAGSTTGNAFAFYSVVDMNQNGGAGDVVVKNVQLSNVPMTERLTATRHGNGGDVWVVYHGWNNANFYAFKVTCEGIEAPVVSQIGYAPGPDPLGLTTSAGGCMKLNRWGYRMATAWTDVTSASAAGTFSRVFVELYDFNGFTGEVLNFRRDTIGTGLETLAAYGVEFSLSGDVLYVNDNGLVGGVSTTNVYQYNCSDPDPMSTRIIVGSGALEAHGTMQLAPDSRIYIARSNGANFLSTINQPDIVGPGCGYTPAGFGVTNGMGTLGLPNHWDSYPTDILPLGPILYDDTVACTGEFTIDANFINNFENASYLWNTGETTSEITVTQDGTYTVEIFRNCSTLYDTVDVVITWDGADVGPDQILCDGKEVQLNVSLAPAPGEVFWSTGDTTFSIIATQEDWYRVWHIDTTGCVSSDSLFIDVQNCACPLYLPNAFTPNADGKNDTFLPVMDCVPITYEMLIFNRWGELVYSTTDPYIGWDGSNLDHGVYAYLVQFSWQGFVRLERRSHRGHITLLR